MTVTGSTCLRGLCDYVPRFFSFFFVVAKIVLRGSYGTALYEGVTMA